jgi:hypothetical protein
LVFLSVTAFRTKKGNDNYGISFKEASILAGTALKGQQVLDTWTLEGWRYCLGMSVSPGSSTV